MRRVGIWVSISEGAARGVIELRELIERGGFPEGLGDGYFKGLRDFFGIRVADALRESINVS